jgi:hypothetical protein
MLNLRINLTYTGLPDDCNFIGEIKVSKEYSLDDLKQQVMTMPVFEGRENSTTLNECVRIRDKLNNTFFGKIYRPGNKNDKTLSNLGIKNNQNLVVQVL